MYAGGIFVGACKYLLDKLPYSQENVRLQLTGTDSVLENQTCGPARTLLGMPGDNSFDINDASAGDAFIGPAPSTSRKGPHARRINVNECITMCEPLVLSQLWTIENIESIMKLSRPGQCFRSAVFRESSMQDACWQLCLYPNGKRDENAGNVSLFLKMSSTAPSKEVILKAEYKFFFLDDNDQPSFSNVNIGEFHAKPPKGGHSWGLRNIPKQKVHNSIRRDNSLVISCQIELMPEQSRMVSKKVMHVPHCNMTEIPDTHIKEELELLHTAEGADCAIEVGDTSTPVHRFKLKTHSAVFRAMFDHPNMEEAKNGVLKISDCSPKAVKLMLEFIYCGKMVTELTREDSIEVMILAEKYDIGDLKSVCEHHLIKTTTRENVCNTLEVADLHQAKTLQLHCFDMIITHKNTVMASDAYRRLRENEPRLANILLERIIQNEQSPPPMKRSRI